MTTPWVRLWRDMPNDPKFRSIARKAQRPVSDVIAVFVTMMTAADDDGAIASWNAEDTAAGLDLDIGTVTAIYDAMNGKVLDGKSLTGWRKRQPRRDDDSRDRVRAFRERKRTETHDTPACNADVTHGNAPDSDSDSDKKDTPLPPMGEDELDPVRLYEALTESKPKRPPKPAAEPIQVLAAFEAYNARALVLGLPQASKLTPQRQRMIRCRLREWGDDGWAKALANLDTPFLRGLTRHGFRADLDFVCQPKSFGRLHDGGYAQTPGANNDEAARPASADRRPTERERLVAALERGNAFADGLGRGWLS